MVIINKAEGCKAVKLGVSTPTNKIYGEVLNIAREIGPIYGATLYDKGNSIGILFPLSGNSIFERKKEADELIGLLKERLGV